MKVPFLDLRTQYELIQDEIDVALHKVLDKTAFAGGPFVEQFENEFAAFCDCKYAIGVGNGTDALWLSLVALGIKQGDEVITVPNTFIATAEAISLAGAKPVFVDVDEDTYNMDPTLLEDAITPRTKAIIPVHLYGQMVDMDPVMEIARKHNLHVIEDACQAHGAEYKGKRAGSIGDTGCFSFYPGKNLGAYGEAGAITTNNAKLAETMRVFRDHGQPKKYYHTMIGWNARMDGFQGAVLSVKLKYLKYWNEARRNFAQIYKNALAGIDCIKLPTEADFARSVYHIFPIRIEKRNALMNLLAEKDIHCAIHYPVPIHLQQAYEFLGQGKGSFPIAERSAEELLSLPMYPELTKDQINYVTQAIKHILTTNAEYAVCTQKRSSEKEMYGISA